MVRSAAALGTVVVCELTGGFGAEGLTGFEALASEHLQEETMPHISVKLFPGRSEDTKQRLADAIVKDVVNITGCDESSVSVVIEEVPSGEWREKVYEPDIRAKERSLYKKPGYSM
ncbi:MAG: tautomerase family protein [Desulfomicrobium sp.]